MNFTKLNELKKDAKDLKNEIGKLQQNVDEKVIEQKIIKEKLDNIKKNSLLDENPNFKAPMDVGIVPPMPDLVSAAFDKDYSLKHSRVSITTEALLNAKAWRTLEELRLVKDPYYSDKYTCFGQEWDWLESKNYGVCFLKSEYSTEEMLYIAGITSNIEKIDYSDAKKLTELSYCLNLYFQCYPEVLVETDYKHFLDSYDNNKTLNANMLEFAKLKGFQDTVSRLEEYERHPVIKKANAKIQAQKMYRSTTERNISESER